MTKNNDEKNKGEKEVKDNAPQEIKAETPSETLQEKTTEEKLAEANDKYVRLYADFENFRKRTAKERMELLKFAGEDIFRQLIPIIDDFERAMKAAAQATDIETIKQGELLIYNKFKTMLNQYGIKEMNAAGLAFDPDIHEAVTNIPAPSDDKKGKVIEEVEKGYYYNEKVIRHAKVVVGS